MSASEALQFHASDDDSEDTGNETVLNKKQTEGKQKKLNGLVFYLGSKLKKTWHATIKPTPC